MTAHDDKKLSRLKDHVTAAMLLDHKTRSLESSLLLTKWFEYRFMSPLEATIHFGRLYRDACRSFVGRYVDRDKAQIVNGVSLSVPAKPNSEFTQLWRARQRADEVGLRYELYLQFTMDFAFARKRKGNMCPRPSQLHASKKTSDAWFGKFRPYFLERRFIDMHRAQSMPEFWLENDLALPAQLYLREFLREGIRTSTSPWHMRVESFALESRLVPLSAFEEMMGEERYTDLIAHLPEVTQAPPHRVNDVNLWQSCFGLPGARQPGSSPCSSCPQSARCAALGELVTRKVSAVGLGPDPVDRMRRMNNTADVRRLRQRKAALKASLPAPSCA